MENGYLAAEIDFSFPEDCLFPNLPVLVNKDLYCYPRNGTSIIGGLEIKAALVRGALINNVGDA